jgi:hypothetical protein
MIGDFLEGELRTFKQDYYDRRPGWDRAELLLCLAGVTVLWQILLPWILLMRFVFLRDEF